MYASNKGHLEIVSTLLHYKSDVDAEDNVRNQMMMMMIMMIIVVLTITMMMVIVILLKSYSYYTSHTSYSTCVCKYTH